MSESMQPVESAPLSVEAAISSLTETPQAHDEAPVEAGEAPEPEPEIEAAPTAEDDASEPDEAADGAEDEEPAEAAAPVEAPVYWSQDAKAKFAELPPELQAVVLAQEGPREAAAAKAKQDAADYRAQADQEVFKVHKLAEQLNDFLPKALESFRGKWDGIDWEAWVEQDPEAALKAKFAFDADQATLGKLQAATQEADDQAHVAFLKAEAAKLPELAPDLADPVAGPERRTKVAQHLLSMGIAPEALKTISAAEMAIAYDAYLYRQAKAGLTAVPKPKPTPAKPVVRPAAAAPPQNRTTNAANRFAQTRSVDDAIAVLLSRG
jgi:hypothetical protein